MVKPFLAMIAVFVATSLVTYASLHLNQDKGILDSNLKTEAEVYPFKLTMILSKDDFELHEKIIINWILTNIGNNTEIAYSPDFTISFKVYDENFNLVYLSKPCFEMTPACAMPYRSVDVKPGSNVSGQMILDPKNFGEKIVGHNSYFLSIYISAKYLPSLGDGTIIETPPIKVTFKI